MMPWLPDRAMSAERAWASADSNHLSRNRQSMLPFLGLSARLKPLQKPGAPVEKGDGHVRVIAVARTAA
jgi:hypothetical protein